MPQQVIFFSKKQRIANLKEQLYNLHTLVLNGHITEDNILELITRQNDFDILISLIDDPIIRTYLYHDKLQKFWDSQLIDNQALHDKFDLKYPYQNLHRHPLIPSLNVLVGYYYYNKSQRARVEEKGKLFLAKAAEYGCFSAILEINKKDLEELFAATDNNDPTANPPVEQIFTRMTQLANLHATPGFIQLAITCLHIAKYWLSIKNHAVTRASCEVALESLYTANILLPYSQGIIQNACFGQGLAMSNMFGITDIPTLISLLLQEYAEFFDVNTFNCAIQRAEAAAKMLIPALSETAAQNQTNGYLVKPSLFHEQNLPLPDPDDQTSPQPQQQLI